MYNRSPNVYLGPFYLNEWLYLDGITPNSKIGLSSNSLHEFEMTWLISVVYFKRIIFDLKADLNCGSFKAYYLQIQIFKINIKIITNYKNKPFSFLRISHIQNLQEEVVNINAEKTWLCSNKNVKFYGNIEKVDVYSLIFRAQFIFGSFMQTKSLCSFL